MDMGSDVQKKQLLQASQRQLWHMVFFNLNMITAQPEAESKSRSGKKLRAQAPNIGSEPALRLEVIKLSQEARHEEDGKQVWKYNMQGAQGSGSGWSHLVPVVCGIRGSWSNRQVFPAPQGLRLSRPGQERAKPISVIVSASILVTVP